MNANWVQSGPVKPPQPRQRHVPEDKPEPVVNGLAASDEKASSSSEAESDISARVDVSQVQSEVDRPRKRRRIEADDLEASYFERLAKEEEREQRHRRQKRDESPSQALKDLSDIDDEDVAIPEDNTTVPVHEALARDKATSTEDKTKRTVFLSNVSVDAIKSKTVRKTLLKHLEGPLEANDSDPKHDKIESIRFRSTAYTAGSGPKKAGFATKELMEQTTKSTNAYVVFSSETAARGVAKKLNGTVVLDRHLRIDHLANPSNIDHKRCVFVGNLNFVDDEVADDKTQDDDSKPPRRKARFPADAEEGLWRTFSKVAKVENVRVVRDKQTRVGKGFAYVQFADQNGVEAALLLDEKKFPPLLPRKLRVMRAKKSRDKISRPVRGKPSLESRGRMSRIGKRPQSGGSWTTPRPSQEGAPNKLVFEGHRASKSSLKDSKQKKRRSPKITSRSAKRGATFKAGGGKKKRDGTM